MSVIIKQFLHSLELCSLPLCKIVFVSWATIERQRVVRVLRVLLVEDIILAVIPIGEWSTIRTRLLDRPRWLNNLIHFTRGSFSFLSAELSFIRCGKVHSVWIDNLALLFQIESLFMRLDLSLHQFAVIILAIVREERFWIRIFNKSISAAGHPCALTLVASWQLINYKMIREK